jgi:hypothetical protein
MGAGSTKAGLEVGGDGRVETRRKLLWRVWPTPGIILVDFEIFTMVQRY